MNVLPFISICFCTYFAIFILIITAQTYTVCDPLKVNGCQPCKALGKTISVNFTEGASPLFSPVASPEQIRYTEEGVEFIVSKHGHNPTLQSDFYIMFGRVEVILKASKGKGIVSSFVLQSDSLDEIDLEWIGEDSRRFQTNFFSQGDTSSYDRGEFHICNVPQEGYHNYTVDWTDKRTIWYYDNQEVRMLPGESPAGYPQTPMAIRIGSWAGGDPLNPPGTIEWAGGVTDYSKGPYVFTVKSLLPKDYSTGFEYAYGDQSGSWMSIQALGGAIKGEFDNNDFGWGEFKPEPSYNSLHLSKDKYGLKPSTRNLYHNSKHSLPSLADKDVGERANEGSKSGHTNIFTTTQIKLKDALSSLKEVKEKIDGVSISAFRNEKYPSSSPFPIASSAKYKIIEQNSASRNESIISLAIILGLVCIFYF